MAGVKIVSGKHRSLELAERHAKQLARKSGGRVEIISRRNANGKFSKRGNFFQFKITPPPEKEKKFKGELTIATKYVGGKKNSQPLMTDVRIFVRRKKTEKQIKEAVAKFIVEESNLPNWLSVDAYTWNNGGRRKQGDIDDFRGLFFNGAPYNSELMELIEGDLEILEGE